MANEAADLISAFYRMVDDPATPISALEDFFADGFIDHDRPPSAPATVPDRHVTLNLFAELRSGFPGAVHSLDILAPVGPDRAMVYWTFSGTQSGPFFGAPASNRPVSINGVDIFRVSGGKFSEQWHVEELMALFAQIGPQ